MKGVYPWIYVDYKDNIWKFSINENKELSYGIMYKEGKWTKEILIDTNILGFAVYIDENEEIHLVYSNTKGELKYCTIKDKQWVGKILYKLESNDFQIENLKVEIIGSYMHIFYLLVGNDGSDHGVLMHCIWNGHDTIFNTLQDIILISNLREHYSVSINNKGDIYVFFLSDEGDEISLNYCSFENDTWMPTKRFYGIQGEEVGFEVAIDKKHIHILNKSKEGSTYFLDHVLVDPIGNLKDFKIHESKDNLLEPLIFIENNKLCSCWLEKDKIFYSTFDEDKWGNPVYFDRGNKDKLERYNSFIRANDNSYIREKKIYGTIGLDLYFYDPSDFLINMKDSLIYDKNKTNESSKYREEIVESLRTELSRAKLENKNLQNRISHLDLEMQKKQKLVKEYEQQITRALEQKRKADENCNVFLELQKKIQAEFEVTSKQLLMEKEVKEEIEEKLKEGEKTIDLVKEQLKLASEEKYKLSLELEYINKKSEEEREYKFIIENKLKESEKENFSLKEKIILINGEKEKLSLEILSNNKQLIKLEESKLMIENKLKEYIQENVLIKKESELLNDENKKLQLELELEKNQSVMERLLRRRSSRGQENF